MNAECEILLKFDDERVAETVSRSLSIENAGYVQQKVEGSFIRAHISARTVRALRNTIDDYLACARVAELNARKALTSR